MSEETATVHQRSRAGDLHGFVVQAMAAVGASGTDAAYMADQLIASELANHPSHGMRRLPEYVDRALKGFAQPGARASIELDTGSLVRMNGNGTYGHFALRDATALAVARAKAHGIAAVAVRNSEYAGRFAPFCEEAANAGVATLLFGNNNGAGQVVVPPGGTRARLSTNPIAAGVPRSSAPHLVIDFATSTVAGGRLAEERDRGTELSGQWVTPEGLLKPFGGFKGFGLALLVEALGGALTGSETVSERKTADHQGTLVIAIDVAQLRELHEFTAQVEEFIAHVKSGEPEDGNGPIRVPGEGPSVGDSYPAGHPVEVNARTWSELGRIARELKLAMPGAVQGH
ncbi:malate/lactate/ureidoglycolate dehydrogenase [Paeniglutamicibacter psychrophenolicus]|uniref:Oxidoreductase n=1 Tax=Paeniglutamicibacter psychrophenolicus TaxID=257454 RepID=A0ABS4W8E4_9MICC|nr:putative oxidoreductase [Paeniglutamicibacter psychrophenolicus]